MRSKHWLYCVDAPSDLVVNTREAILKFMRYVYVHAYMYNVHIHMYIEIMDSNILIRRSIKLQYKFNDRDKHVGI